MNKLFVTAASVTVPYFTVVVRKAYGLGAQAMSGGAMMGGENFCVAWPTAEFGPMGLEGAVMLGFSKELAKAKKEGGREQEKNLFDLLVAGAYEQGKALSNAVQGGIDDVIDPASTRAWIAAGLSNNPIPLAYDQRPKKKRPSVSPW